MRLYLRASSIFFIVAFLASCVKDEPFIQPYSVPPTYNFENKDSSGTARLIMMYGLKNYLSTGANAQLDSVIIDSLWINRGAPFTESMVPNFLYTSEAINKMTSVTLLSGIADVDSTMALADSMVANSQFYNRAASNGTPGTATASQPVSLKKLFSKDGVVFDEVWFNSMLGAMAMRSIFTQLGASGTTAGPAWNLAFTFTGLPADYDPSVNYEAEPLRRNRPLGIAAYFGTEAKSAGTGPKIYEEFRRGRSAVEAGDSRVSSISQEILRSNIEKTLAVAAISYLDGAKRYTDVPSKLTALSRAYGLVIALKHRSTVSALSNDNYGLLRAIFKERFYTLAQDASYAKIDSARALLAAAYN